MKLSKEAYEQMEKLKETGCSLWVCYKKVASRLDCITKEGMAVFATKEEAAMFFAKKHSKCLGFFDGSKMGFSK